MALSRPFVEGYWLGYAATASSNPPGNAQELSDIPTNTPLDVVKIAFYNLYPNNGVSTCFGMSQKHGWKYTQQGIQALQAAGSKVLISLIGTPDPSVGWNDIPDPDAFAANVKGLLIDQLGADGIDIDNEGGPDPNDNFIAVVKALRNALGPKGSPGAILTDVTYLPDRDLPWLKEVGDELDWVTTMAYWLDAADQEALWGQYANVMGAANVLIGVSCCSGSQTTQLQTVQQVAQWETQQGTGQTGGMMLWNLSGADKTQTYYNAIRQNLTIWTPPT